MQKQLFTKNSKKNGKENFLREIQTEMIVETQILEVGKSNAREKQDTFIAENVTD